MSLPNPTEPRHALLPDKASSMVRIDVRKADAGWWREEMGRVVQRVKGALSLKEFADLVARDEREVSKWLDASRRPQLDAIFAVERFRLAFVLALAELAGAEIEHHIRIKKAG